MRLRRHRARVKKNLLGCEIFFEKNLYMLAGRFNFTTKQAGNRERNRNRNRNRNRKMKLETKILKAAIMNTTASAELNLSRIRFQHPLPDGGLLVFTAPIVGSTIANRGFLIRIPSKVRSIPFPPFGGKKLVAINPAAISPSTISLA